MLIFTNDKLIAQRARMGNMLVFVGLGSLVIALVTNFLTTSNPGTSTPWLYVSLAAMLVGLVTTMIGSPSVRRFGRSPRPDELIAEALKGFDARYHFYAYTLPAELVLVGPSGIYAFVVSTVDGKITGKGDRLNQPATFLRVLSFFGRESMGDPVREAKVEAEHLSQFLREKLPELEVPVQPVVVFASKTALLDLENPSIAIVTRSMLKGMLRGSGKMVLSERVRKPVAALFDQTSGVMGKKD